MNFPSLRTLLGLDAATPHVCARQYISADRSPDGTIRITVNEHDRSGWTHTSICGLDDEDARKLAITLLHVIDLGPSKEAQP